MKQNNRLPTSGKMCWALTRWAWKMAFLSWVAIRCWRCRCSTAPAKPPRPSSPFRHLFERQTVAKLAELVAEPSEADTLTSSVVVQSEARTHYPLSVAQQGIWFLWKLEPDSPYYTAQGVIHLRGEIDVNILQRAWQALIDRHVILRAKFGVDENGRPVQSFPQRQDNLQAFDLTQPLSRTARSPPQSLHVRKRAAAP